MLFDPEIRRLPVIPRLYAKAPKDYPIRSRKTRGRQFNDELHRVGATWVNSLYDHIITFRHKGTARGHGRAFIAPKKRGKKQSGQSFKGNR